MTTTPETYKPGEHIRSRTARTRHIVSHVRGYSRDVVCLCGMRLRLGHVTREGVGRLPFCRRCAAKENNDASA